MKTQNKMRLLSYLFVSLILLLCSVTAFSGAEEKPCSITLRYEISGAEFSIYKVGDITASGAVCTEEFARYNVDLYSDNSGQTLAAYIERDNIPALMTEKTNSKGEVLFDGLSKGVYLTTGEFAVHDGIVYSVMPSIISVPALADGVEQHDVAANVKYGKRMSGSGKVGVVKVWKTSSGKPLRPEITVQLLRNGEIYDTVVLSESNSWKHTWTDLDIFSQWLVTEKEIDKDYSVDICNNNYIFTITNTEKEQQETTVPTTSPDTAPTTAPSTPPSTAPTTSPSQAPTTKPYNPPTIPQTGQLNWPVPVLSITGVLLVLVGLLLMRKNKHE